MGLVRNVVTARRLNLPRQRLHRRRRQRRRRVRGVMLSRYFHLRRATPAGLGAAAGTLTDYLQLICQTLSDAAGPVTADRDNDVSISLYRWDTVSVLLGANTNVCRSSSLPRRSIEASITRLDQLDCNGNTGDDVVRTSSWHASQTFSYVVQPVTSCCYK